MLVLLIIPFSLAESANVTLLKNVSDTSGDFTGADSKGSDGKWIYNPENEQKNKPRRIQIITSIAKALKDFFKSLGL